MGRYSPSHTTPVIIDEKHNKDPGEHFECNLGLSSLAWRRPTFPRACALSILGAGGLNGRVRDGYACVPSALITRPSRSCCEPGTPCALGLASVPSKPDILCLLPTNPTSQVKPSTDSYPSAPRITTLPRRTDLPCLLQGVLLHCWMGDVILREASRLDAFSAYPFPTWLPSGALGRTTGTPAVGSSRSSRTKDESSHVSYARGR